MRDAPVQRASPDRGPSTWPVFRRFPSLLVTLHPNRPSARRTARLSRCFPLLNGVSAASVRWHSGFRVLVVRIRVLWRVGRDDAFGRRPVVFDVPGWVILQPRPDVDFAGMRPEADGYDNLTYSRRHARGESHGPGRRYGRSGQPLEGRDHRDVDSCRPRTRGNS